MAKFVTIHLDEEMARDAASAHPMMAATKKLQNLAKKFGGALEAQHPGTSDPELAKHFVIKVSDDHIADQVRDQIAATGLAQGVYVKPKDAPPGASP